MNVSKAFERVKRQTLVASVADLGYPTNQVRLSLHSYAWERRLVDGALTSEALVPTIGIGAGSAFATFELVAYVLADLRSIQAGHPKASLSLRVGGFTPQIRGDDETYVINSTMQLTEEFVERLEVKLGLPFGPQKAQLTSTSKRVATTLLN